MTKTDDLMALAEKYQCSESPLKSARELRTAIEQALLQAHKAGFDAALLPGSVPDAQPVATLREYQTAINIAREKGFRDGREFETHPPSFGGSAIASLTTQVSMMEAFRKATRDLLQTMVSSSTQILDGDEVVGYQIKTGALHKLVGLHQGIDAVSFPANLPSIKAEQAPTTQQFPPDYPDGPDREPPILTTGEPVAVVRKHTGSLKDMAFIFWIGEQPPEGTKLYTHPPAPTHDEFGLIGSASHAACKRAAADIAKHTEPSGSQPARKIGGSYQADGYIVSRFTTTAGAERVVFEFNEPKGMLHIFTPEQIEVKP